MRLPRVRLTLGRLMVSVAVVDLTLATYSAYRRSLRHRALARVYTVCESEMKGLAETTRDAPPGLTGFTRDLASRMRRRADYYGSLRAA